MKKLLTLGRVLAVIGATVTVAGCNPFHMFGHRSSKPAICKEPEGYAKANEAKVLTIPAGLENPDTRNALRIPDLNTPEPPPRNRDLGCLDEPPSYTLPPKPKQPAG